MAVTWTLGCDAADPQSLAVFWAAALGYVREPGFDEPDNASIVDPDDRGPALGFLYVPEPKTSKNRMHVDVRVSEGHPPADHDAVIRTEVARLVALGATMMREEYDEQGVIGHVVMHDPEGNEFCVA